MVTVGDRHDASADRRVNLPGARELTATGADHHQVPVDDSGVTRVVGCSSTSGISPRKSRAPFSLRARSSMVELHQITNDKHYPDPDRPQY
jgi:hypothetical protein